LRAALDRLRWTVRGRRLAEVFIEGSKDSPLLALARDAAIIASIGLQFGVPVDVIRHALAGPLAAALALVDGATP